VIEKVPTAALVHSRDSTQIDFTGKPRVEQFFFWFVDEGRGWKVDGFASIHAIS
jgi:hypothetical protein